MEITLLDYLVFFIFVGGVALFGCSFYFRSRKGAAAFTAAEGSLPTWVVGMSIFATFVSSISFLGLPGDAYKGNWNPFVFSLSIPIATWLAAKVFIPLYRGIDSVSAYHYLEMRFGYWARCYVAVCYLLTQLARVGSILLLLALPLNTMFGWDIQTIIVCTGIVLMIVGGIKGWLIPLGIGGVGLVGTLYVILVQKGILHYGENRINTWRDPFNAEWYRGDGWQIAQCLIAIGSGGLLGVGLGKGRQKFLYLPEEHNDCIFAVICEELGLVGACVIMLVFALLILRGFWIALHARDRFGALLVVGFMTLTGLQTFLNIAVVTGLVPATGISLPFFSYGGTALLCQLAEMGIVLNISRVRYQSPQRAPAAERAPQAEVQLQGGNA